MKLALNWKQVCTGLAAALALTAGTAFTALAGTVSGSLDHIDSTISGWAWDPSQPEAAAEVTVIVSDSAGQVVTELTATANIYREDLAAAGKGTGSYGFSVPMDWDSAADGVYTVRAYAMGCELPGSRHYVKGGGAAGAQSLGTFKITAYCPCYSCSEGWGRQTSTGAIARARHTIAVDPRVIPYGTKIMINGVVYTAEDRGGGVKGNHIDMFFDTHQETRIHGTTYQEVFVV